MASSSAPGSSSPPPNLNGYILTEKIGSGTYAVVYKAFRKTGPREVVAVKCVSKSSLNNVSKENLLTEIELLKTLHHENIVELKDFTWDENYIYVIMEYCSGGDLSTFIRGRRTLPENIARRFLRQLAAALHYMRSMHVSHMDLKPSNILLSSSQNPRLKIGDFGFAHYLIGETEAMFLRGSLLYMAPEIITLRQYNEKADLWSVGVILYECLFGRAPFASKTMQELRSRIKDKVPVEIPVGVDISDSCRDLLTRLLQRDPDRRINYDEFLDHTFLDLDGRSCSESLKMASELAARAKRKDDAAEHEEAVGLYCEAIEYFISAIHYERNETTKNQLRKEASKYVKRAEELKQSLKPKTYLTAYSSSTTTLVAHGNVHHDALTNDPFNELVSLCGNNTVLLSALKVARTAEAKEEMEDYISALEKYEKSLEILLRLVSDEAKGRRRELLHTQISRWMSRAETIKKYLTVKDLNTKDIARREDEDGDSWLSHSYASCVLQ